MKDSSRRYLWVIPALIVAALAMAGYISWRMNRLRVPVDRVPPPSTMPREPAKTDPAEISAFLDEFELFREDSQLVIRKPASGYTRLQEPELPETRIRMDETANLVHGGTASMRLLGVALPGEPIESDNEWNRWRLPFTFYGPDGVALDEEAVARLVPNPWDRSLGMGNPRGATAIRVKFDATVPDTVRHLEHSFHDHATGRRLARQSWSGSNDPLGFRSAVAINRPVPVDIYMDLARGRSESARIDLVEGARFSFRGGEVRLVAIEGAGDGHSFSTSLSHTMAEYSIRRNTPSGEATETDLVLAFYPDYYVPAIQMDIYGPDGEPIPGGGSSGSGGTDGSYLQVYHIAVPPEQLSHIEFTVYHDWERLILELDRIPGMPETNAGASDLLDVRFSYLEFEEEWQMRNFVSEQTGLNLTIQPWTGSGFPINYFPVVYRDVTVREILMDFARQGYNTETIEIDLEKGQIVIEPPIPGKAKSWIQELIEKVFP